MKNPWWSYSANTMAIEALVFIPAVVGLERVNNSVTHVYLSNTKMALPLTEEQHCELVELVTKAPTEE